MKTLTLIAAALVAANAAPAQTLHGKHSNGPAHKKTAVQKAAPLSDDTHPWPTGEYKDLGTGKMTDDMVSPLFKYRPVTYDVQISQSVENPAFYRVHAPYGKAWADAMFNVNGVTLTDAQYDVRGLGVIDIDATDPDDVYFAKTPIYCNWGYGDMSIGINSRYNVTFADGIFSAPELAIAVVDDDGAVAMNRNRAFRIILPGYATPDHTLELDLHPVTDKNLAEGTVAVGSDVATVRYKVFPDFQEDELNIARWEDIANNGIEMTMRGAITLDMTGYAKLTIAATGLDAAGKMVCHDWASVYNNAIHTDADWADCGTATLHEAFMQNLVQIAPQDVQCTLQRHTMRPAYLRLANPLAGHTHFAQYGHDGQTDHNHYIYINADDPECIFVEESPLCLNFGFGYLRISSAPQYFMDAGYDFEEIKELEMGALLDDSNLLTFPDEHLIVSMTKYDNGDWYNDSYAETSVQLPADFSFDAVGDIDAPAAQPGPAKYYNLQGCPIAKATPGTVVIKVQDGKATKTVAR